MAKERTDAELLRHIGEARALVAREGRIEPHAVEAWGANGMIMIILDNGCFFGFRVEDAAGLPKNATEKQLDNVVVEQDGESLHWPDLDADVSVPGIIAKLLSVQAWGSRLLGRSTSEAKARAARENGQKGGRPPRVSLRETDGRFVDLEEKTRGIGMKVAARNYTVVNTGKIGINATKVGEPIAAKTKGNPTGSPSKESGSAGNQLRVANKAKSSTSTAKKPGTKKG